MRFLFVHQNFPGQYRHLAPELARRGHHVVAVGEKRNLLRPGSMLPGVDTHGYELPALEAPPPPLQSSVQSAIHRGRTVAQGVATLARSGFRPDVVCAHIGWGEALFLKDVLPNAKLLLYSEFFYRARGSDVGFDPEFPPTAERILRLRVKNAPLLMSLDAADWGITPTHWQQRQFPDVYAQRMSVIHEGVDTDAVTPDPAASFRVPGTDVTLSREDEVVTYVSRNLEPYRGFHVFMRAVPEIQRRRPKAKIVIVGGDDVSYSAKLPPGETYRARALRELEGRIDLSRVFMTGRIPYVDYLALLRISSAHVYLTYPFVLSWSMLEAMAAGCLVVGSRTPPVQEVIRHGQNGFLANFFSPAEIAEQVEAALARPERMEPLREAARRTVVERYDLKRVCLPAQAALAENLMLERLAA
jgi:glycosyltransferase involved in cell wall biosynthesis